MVEARHLLVSLCKKSQVKSSGNKWRADSFVVFLCALFFISGVRAHDFIYISISLCLLLAFYAFIKAIECFWPGKRKFNFSQLLGFKSILLIIASMFLGAEYFNLRCGKYDLMNAKRGYRNIVVTIEASSITLRSKEDGVFYGYGKIKKTSKASDKLVGQRLFFSSDLSLCDELPVVGQEFNVSGDLKFVKNGSSWWFYKHLRDLKISYCMSNGCLLSCNGSAPALESYFRKVFDKFTQILSLGVENRAQEFGIITGMLTGAKNFVDNDIRCVFNDLGIAHLFAVSGLHIGIIAVVIDFFLRLFRVKKKRRSLLVLLALGFYVKAIGASPSSIRALTMFSFYFASVVFNRAPNVLAALANSALLSVLADPFVVFNISFLLSYSVVGGIVLIGVQLKRLLSRIFLVLNNIKLEAYPIWYRIWFHIKRYLIFSFSISFSAYIAGLPFSVDKFGVLSLITVPVNMVIVPLATCAIVVGAISLFFGLFNFWIISMLLNKISCYVIYILSILLKAMYFDSLCLRNVKIPFVSGAVLTLVMLVIARMFFEGKIFAASVKAADESFLSC